MFAIYSTFLWEFFFLLLSVYTTHKIGMKLYLWCISSLSSLVKILLIAICHFSELFMQTHIFNSRQYIYFLLTEMKISWWLKIHVNFLMLILNNILFTCCSYFLQNIAFAIEKKLYLHTAMYPPIILYL